MDTLVWILVISSFGMTDIQSRPMVTLEQCEVLRDRAISFALARNERPLRNYTCVQFRIVK